MHFPEVYEVKSRSLGQVVVNGRAPLGRQHGVKRLSGRYLCAGCRSDHPDCCDLERTFLRDNEQISCRQSLEEVVPKIVWLKSSFLF